MTNHAEDICRVLHMAKVFPCLLPLGKTDNDNYTRNNDKIKHFSSVYFTNCKQSNKHHRQQLGRLSFDLRWSLINSVDTDDISHIVTCHQSLSVVI